MITATALPGSFGARLHLGDFDLDAAAASEFRRLLAQHGLLLLRGREISVDQHARLLSYLGRIEPEADGSPMLMHVSNTRADTSARDASAERVLSRGFSERGRATARAISICAAP